jgi:hypothetical protein
MTAVCQSVGVAEILWEGGDYPGVPTLSNGWQPASGTAFDFSSHNIGSVAIMFCVLIPIRSRVLYSERFMLLHILKRIAERNASASSEIMAKATNTDEHSGDDAVDYHTDWYSTGSSWLSGQTTPA